MKNISILFFALIILCSMSVITNATLIDNLNGTITQIRDDSTHGDGSKLMWIQDTYSFVIFGEEFLWSTLDTINSNKYLGYNDWRLPSQMNSDGSGPCNGFNCMDSELGYMYYVELGNTMWIDAPPYQYYLGFYNSGPFNMYGPGCHTCGDYFATGTENHLGYFNWSHDYLEGTQGPGSPFGDGIAPQLWIVRDVPEPSTILLVCTGLAGLGLLRRRFKS